MPGTTVLFDPPPLLNIADWLLHERVREGRGERVALRLDDRTFTYAEVSALARRWSGALRQLGVRPEERVLLALADGPEYVGALFGILGCGAVAVMVNPGFTPAELAPVLGYVRARWAVVGAEALPVFSAARGFGEAGGHLAGVLTVGVPDGGELRFEEVDSADAFSGAVFPTHRDDPAIWLFSGGTTGRPKAVVQTHRSYANTTELYARRFLGYREDDVTVAVPKLFFGYATGSNLFFPFSVGASAVLFPERVTTEVLLGKIRRHRPTILVNVPTMVQHLVANDGATAEDLASLRFATSAGEALPVPLYHRWRERFGVELLDGLGTAEMWHIFLSNRPGEVRPGTLGRAVPGFDVRVRDEDGRDLAPGEVGRLWVRGGSRAWGYWQELDRSAETFRGEWVVLGDLVVQDGEGYITYCGRADDVLKVGGKWLAPQEVESCLMRHPRVRECAVIGVETADGLIKPWAFVVASDPGEGLAAELREHVACELSPYKHPREIRLLHEFPRTHLGKIDRGALRRLAFAAP